jgi:hypothetical protein
MRSTALSPLSSSPAREQIPSVRVVSASSVPLPPEGPAAESTRVWLLFSHDGSDKRAVAVTPHSPRRGRRVPVQVAPSAIEAKQVYLLVRKIPGDLVVAAAAEPESLEGVRRSLGNSADQYEVRAVPVVEA